MQRCAVTGANGYVGSRVSEYLVTRGWKVFEFSRRPSAHRSAGRVHIPFQLDSPIQPSVFRDNDIRVLIHCAYDFRLVNRAEIHRVNVDGSVRLLRTAREAGVDTIIFLSSISAFDGCRSLYGKAKLEIEKSAADVGAFTIRPGLVYGDRPSGGLFGSLHRIATRSAFIPLVGSGRYVQYLVHMDDLCGVLLSICRGEMRFSGVPMIVAAPHGWQICELLQALAGARQGRVTFLPVPWRAIWLGLKISELFGLPVPFRSDSVISLVRQNPNPDFSLGGQMAYRFREFSNRYVEAPPVGLSQASHGGRGKF